MASTLPDLKLLRIFISVVRHQGFANAQRELNLSTSAISTYMSQLEGALGIVLCHRGRGLQPDQQGRAVPSGNPAPAGRAGRFRAVCRRPEGRTAWHPQPWGDRLHRR